MQYRMIAVAMPLFFASTFASYGQAIVKNSCGDEAYFWSCGDTEGPKVTIAPGSSHSETYAAKTGGGGYSYKLATKYSTGPKAGQAPESIYDLPQPNITQFEITVGAPGPPANMVWYDISNINGYPFVAGGLSVTSSDGSVNVRCPKDVLYCQAAYNQPHDDHATGSAPESVDLTMELCSDTAGAMAAGGSSSSSDSSSSESSDSVSSAAPAPVSSAPVSSALVVSSAAPVVNEKVANKVAAPVSVTPSPSPTTSDEEVVVWVTQTAPVVYVTERVGAQKRDSHIHQHVHNKFNKKRHGNF